MTKQPEALRLADELLFAGRLAHETEEAAAKRRIHRNSEAAKELRRLHEVNQKLLEALVLIMNTCNSDLEYRVNTSREIDIMQACKKAIAKAEESEHD